MISNTTEQQYSPKIIYLESTERESVVARAVRQKVPRAEVRFVSDAETLLPEVHSPRTLLLRRQKGPFIKLCPGTSHYICCLYHNLNVTTNCDLNCSYCILQGYLSNPRVTLYTNTQDMRRELDALFHTQPNRIFRIGTGELTDSLTFDFLYSYNTELIEYFRNKDRALFEVKTKSTRSEKLLGLAHNRRTVVSWSVNAERIIESDESGAPSLEERLKAARAVQDAGYRLGFHFDPMIWFDNWREQYQQVLESIFSFARSDNISWISLGALRYPPALERVIRARHPHSDLVLGELFPGADGKMRYFKPLRIEMFRFMYERIREFSPEACVYLCMESDEIWRKAFGWSPRHNAGLAKILDERVLLP